MDTFALIATERRRLADELDGLGDADWAAASRCAGWTNATVAAHLTLPWEGKRLDLVVGLLRARGNIDKAMDRASRDLADRLPPAEAVASLRAHADDRFVPPTMPPEAPLTDVIVHGADILRPLGRSVDVAPEALAASLSFLVGAKARRGFGARSVDGLRLVATDVDWHHGTPGDPEVTGPALALAGILVGRDDHRPDLAGPALDRLR